MKRNLICGALLLALGLNVVSSDALAKDSRQHRAAMRLCKQKYKDAIRGAKYLRSRQRRERIEQARRERAECERLAPR
jgi:hypothetical protein